MTIFGVHTGLQNTTIDELRDLWTRIEDAGLRLDLDLGPLLLGRLHRLRVPRGGGLPRRPGLPHVPGAGAGRSCTAPATGTRPCWPTPSPPSTTSPAGGPTSGSAPGWAVQRVRRLRHPVPVGRRAARPARGVDPGDPRPAARRGHRLRGRALRSSPRPGASPSRCRPSCRSGSAAAARSARCGSPPATPTAGTCPFVVAGDVRPQARRARTTTAPTVGPRSGRDPHARSTSGCAEDDDALVAQFGKLRRGRAPGRADRLARPARASASASTSRPAPTRSTSPCGRRGTSRCSTWPPRPSGSCAPDDPGVGARAGEPDRRPHRPHRRAGAADGDRPRHDRRPGGAAATWSSCAPPIEPEPAVVPLDVDDPAAVAPAWARYVAGVVAELRPAVGLRRLGRHDAARSAPGCPRRRPSRWPSRWRSGFDGAAARPGPARASAPSSGRPACPAGSWTSSPAPPAWRATPCASTARPSTVTPVADARRRRGGGGRLRPAARAGHQRLRRAGRRLPGGRRPRSGRCATPTLADLDRAAPTRCVRRRARHVVTENARVDELRGGAGRRRPAGDGRGAWPPATRSLRDDFEVSTAGARRARRPARRRSTA